jgi:hypothetical protein
LQDPCKTLAKRAKGELMPDTITHPLTPEEIADLLGETEAAPLLFDTEDGQKIPF